MPILQNPRHEFFAQARALGARLEDAYEDAGFAPDRGHASRLALREEVAERIAEVRAEQVNVDAAGAPKVIAALLRLAEDGRKLDSPAALKEARLALVDAHRLHGDLVGRRARDRIDGRSWEKI